MTRSNGSRNNIPIINTIAFRSILAFSIVFFVALLGGTLILTSNQLRDIKEDAKRQNQLSLHQVMTVIEYQINLFTGRLTLLATTPYIENQDPIEAGGFLKGYNVAPLFIPGEHITLYNAKHEKIGDNSMVGIARVNSSYQELQNFKAVEPQRPYVSPLFWEQHTPKKIIAVLVENRAKSDGYLAASFSFRRLWEVFENYKLGDHGFFVIVDESGAIIYHPNIRQWVNGKSRVQDLGIENFTAKSFIPENNYYTLKDGKEYLINYEYRPRLKLGVLAIQPRIEVEKPIKKINKIFIYTSILFVISILITAIWFFNHIETPIQALITKMLVIADGNYEESSSITESKNNEIHALASVFDKMRLTIREKMSALAEHQAHLELEVYKRTEELAKANDRLKTISRTDELTGLPNRRDLREKIIYEISRFDRSKRNFSFLFVDIDKFKEFNDHYGHVCGDIVLKSVAETMKNSLRKQDIIARWGGEEFLALLPETPIGGASLVAERIRKKIADMEILFANQKLRVTITVGVAEYNERLGMEHSINLADRALYEGKQTGRNKVVRFNPEDITEEDLKAAEEELKFAQNAQVDKPADNMRDNS
mgnify:CR=1 FL=1